MTLFRFLPIRIGLALLIILVSTPAKALLRYCNRKTCSHPTIISSPGALVAYMSLILARSGESGDGLRLMAKEGREGKAGKEGAVRWLGILIGLLQSERYPPR